MTPAMTTSPRARLFMKSWEKCILAGYRDGGGVWTAGWGATGMDHVTGRQIGPKTRWSMLQADQRFNSDVAIRELALTKLLGKAPTTQGQWDALLSLGYNVGMDEGGLKTSSLLRLHKAGEYALAAKQFPRWSYDNGKWIQGLNNRRIEEALMYQGQPYSLHV